MLPLVVVSWGIVKNKAAPIRRNDPMARNSKSGADAAAAQRLMTKALSAPPAFVFQSRARSFWERFGERVASDRFNRTKNEIIARKTSAMRAARFIKQKLHCLLGMKNAILRPDYCAASYHFLQNPPDSVKSTTRSRDNNYSPDAPNGTEVLKKTKKQKKSNQE